MRLSRERNLVEKILDLLAKQVAIGFPTLAYCGCLFETLQPDMKVPDNQHEQHHSDPGHKERGQFEACSGVEEGSDYVMTSSPRPVEGWTRGPG